MVVRKSYLRSSACVLIFAIATSQHADAVTHDVVDDLHRLNAAVSQVLSARRDLTQFQLEQVSALRQRGHASWFEVARQEVTVDGLAEHLATLLEFVRFLESVQTQLKDVDASFVSASQRGRVYLPRSMRLVGWIDSDSNPLLQPQATASVDRCAREDALLDACEARLKAAEKRYASYQSTQGVPAAWRTHAELQERLARAEWQWIQLRRDISRELDNAYGTVNNTVISADSAAGQRDETRASDHCFTAQHSPALQFATCRVLAAELAAEGAIKLAEVDVGRQAMRLQSITTLHARGFATEYELKQGTARLHHAREQVAELSEQRKTGAESLRKIAGAKHYETLAVAQGHTTQLETKCSWSGVMLRNRERLCYLVELRKRGFELQGERRVQQVKIRWQYELISRLEQNAPPAAATTAGTQKSPTRDSFQEAFASRHQRELASARLTKQYLVARAQQLREQIEILRLEEKRFIVQCEQQDHIHPSASKRHFVSVSTHQQTTIPASRVSQPFRMAARDYWESDAIRERATGLDWTTTSATHPIEYACDPPGDLQGDSYARFSTWTSPTTLSGVGSVYPSESGFANRLPVTGHSRPNAMARQPRYDELKNRFPVTAPWKLYPFGQLRTELRDRLPPGRAPWYLPGSPTNLR